MSVSRPILILILGGFVLRIIVAVWSFGFRENTDVLRYRDWARISYLHNFADTYRQDHISFGTLANNQPPGSLYIVSGMYNINIIAAKIILRVTGEKPEKLQWINGPLLNFTLRLPSIIADLMIGLMIFTLVKTKTSEKLALISSSIFLFNPSVIYNSSFWGQMDSLNNLLFLLSVFFILKKKISFAIICFFASLYVKLSLFFLFPIFLLIVIKIFFEKKNIIISSLVISVVLIGVITLPISSKPYSWIFDFIKNNAGGEIQSITSFAFNFWWMIYKPLILVGRPIDAFNFSEIRLIDSPDSYTLFLNTSIVNWALALFTIFLLPVFYKTFRLKKATIKPEYIFLMFSVISVIGFLFLPRMHERYLYPLFPLLAIYIGLKGKFMLTYIILSLLNLINLYLVWHPMLPPYIPYNIMNNQMFQWTVSIAIVATGSIFYIRSLKYLRA